MGNSFRLLIILFLVGCAADIQEPAALGMDDPKALIDGSPGGSPYTMLIEVPFHNAAQKPAYFMPNKGTAIRIGACTVLSAAHLLLSQRDYYNHSEWRKPDWLLNWDQIRAYPIATDGTLGVARSVKVGTVAIHPSMLDSDEISLVHGQPVVVPGDPPAVDSTFDLVVFQVNGLSSPQSQYQLPVLATQVAEPKARLSVDGNSFTEEGRYLTRLTRLVDVRGMTRAEPYPSLYTQSVMHRGNSGGPLYRRTFGNLEITEIFGILSGQRAVFLPPLGNVTVFSRVDGDAEYQRLSVKAWIEAYKRQHETDPACYSFGN